jgi:hypothetical protein
MVEVVRTTPEGRVRFDLRQLEARAPELMAEGLDVLRVHLDELLELDLRGRPRVRLLVALLVAQARPDDPRADELVRAAWRSFQRAHDDEGLSLAAYVQGCLAEARGNMVAAAEWWSRSREGGYEALPLREGGLVDHGLEAWYGSDLTTARRFGEQGIELARSRANLNDEARGVTLLAILACHEGDFEGADHLAADGLAGADPDDHAGRAVLSCVRAVVANNWGHDEDRRRWFELAVTTAATASKPTPAFHGVALALQAEMGIELPVEDRLRQAWAAAALLSGELPWWRRIAVRAVAVTAAAAGDREASDTALAVAPCSSAPPTGSSSTGAPRSTCSRRPTTSCRPRTPASGRPAPRCKPPRSTPSAPTSGATGRSPSAPAIPRSSACCAPTTSSRSAVVPACSRA